MKLFSLFITMCAHVVIFLGSSDVFASEQAMGTLQHVSSGKCLHPEGGDANPSNGTKVVAWNSCGNESRLKYRFTSGGSIQHVSSGKCLHPQGGLPNPSNGTNLVFWSGCDMSRIAFEITSSGSIRHKASGKCIHPYGGSDNPSNGTKMVLWSGCDISRLTFRHGGERFIYIHGWTDDPRTPYDGAPRKGYDLCHNRSQCNYWSDQLPGFVRHVGWVSSKDDWRTAPVAKTVNLLNQYCLANETPCAVICHSTGCPIIGKAIADYGSRYKWYITRVLTTGSAEGGSELGEYKDDNARFITPAVVRSAYNHNETRGIPFFHAAGHDGGIQSALIDGEDDGVVGFHSACGYVKQFSTSHCSNGWEYAPTLFNPFRTKTVAKWNNHHRIEYCGRDGCDEDHGSIKGLAYQRRALEVSP